MSQTEALRQINPLESKVNRDTLPPKGGKELSQEDLFQFGWDIIPKFEELFDIDNSDSPLEKRKISGREIVIKRAFVKEGFTNEFDISINEKGKPLSHAQRATISLGEDEEKGDKARITYRPFGDFRFVGPVRQIITFTWNDFETRTEIANLYNDLKKELKPARD